MGVVGARLLDVQNLVSNAVRQSFHGAIFDAITAQRWTRVCATREALRGALFFVNFHERRDGRLRSRVAVDVKNAVFHLDAITRKADQAFDIIRAVDGVFEHHNIAAFGVITEDTFVRTFGKTTEIGAKHSRAGGVGIAIGEFVNEQEIANQQRGFHRARRDPERLEQQGADQARQNKCKYDRFDGFKKATVVRGFRCH